MKGFFHIKSLMMLSCLLSCFSFTWGQISISDADAFHCRTDEYARYSQYDSILYYADDALDAFEQVGDWENHIQVMMKKGGALRDKRLLTESQEVFEKALYLAMTKLSASDPLFSDLYANLGLLALWQTNYPEAISWFSQQIKASPEKISQAVAGAEINMGLVYVYLWRFEESRTHCEIGIDILKKLDKENHPYVSNALLNIGLGYSNEDEHELAIQYFEHALEILMQANPRNNAAIANVYGNMSNMHTQLKQYDLALGYLQKSLKLQKEAWGEKHTWVAHCYHNLGRIYSEKGDIPLAIDYTQRALAIRQELLPVHHKDIVKTYTFLGACYKGLKEYDRAIASYKTGIAYREQVAPQAMELVSSREGMADVYALQGDYLAAVAEIDKAIFILNPGDGWESVKNKPRLVSLLGLKAKYLEAHAAGLTGKERTQHLQQALRCYRDACALSNYIQRQRHDDASKNKIASSGQRYGEKGLQLAYDLHQADPHSNGIEDVFWFVENNKASLLHEAVQKSQAELLAGIPDSLRALERSLSLDFTFYDQQLQHELLLQNEGDTAQIKKLKQKTFGIRTQRDSLRKALNQNFPAFHWLSFEAQRVELATVQAALPSPQTLLLDYAFVDSFLYLLAIQREKAQVFQLSWKDADADLLKQFITFLHDSQKAENEGFATSYLQTYAALSLPLYQKLLAPALTAFPQSQELILIPDKSLGHLPFEALLQEALPDGKNPGYSELPFLLKSFPVTYNYAASMPAADSLLKARPKGSFAAFAPEYAGSALADSRESFQRISSESDFAFGRLPASIQEVRDIQKLMGGEVWMGEDASKAHFLQEAGKYRLLHLAMHAFTNDSFPLQSGLVFAPGRDRFLYTFEIYQLALQAELTVLSACHTGSGAYQQGEGIMSLARAFRYAGSPNILMSLWQADDAGTAMLMRFFYQNINEGMGKDEALRQAKLSFIAEGGKPMPHFWAGFVLIGDGAPVDMGGDYPMWKMGIGGLMLLLLGWGIWRLVMGRFGK